MTALLNLSPIEDPFDDVPVDLALDTDRITRLLHPSSRARALYERDLLEIADWIASGVDPSPIIGSALPNRRYRRILHTRSVEAWLIAWGPSTFLGLHDHGGCSAFQVVSGVLEERSTNLDSHALLATVQLGTSGRRSIAPRDVHGVWNPSELPALSVHVYSPPLTSMSFYAHDKTRYLDKVETKHEIDWTDDSSS